MRLLICGGRHYNDWPMFNRVMLSFYRQTFVGLIEVVIHGDAAGADTMAKRWAREHGIPDIACPADWESYGRSAGHVRNREMLVEHKPHAILAFPGGRGTTSMVVMAQRAGLPVFYARKIDSVY